MTALEELTTRMHELRDLAGAISLLSWDQETCMPPKGAEPRAHQLATLQGLYHERLTAPALGEALDQVAAARDASPDVLAMVRALKWERDRALKLSAKLVKELAERQSRSLEAWRQAREKQDFRLFQPHLEALLDLRREQADALGYETERYDALLEGFEPGMRTARLSPLFERLRARLVPLVRAIAESGRPPASPFAGRRFDVNRQWEVSLRVLREMGFDFEAGRQDRSVHPFTGGAGHPGDVRLTTRLSPEDPLSGLMSTIHEGGHGLYEQGFDPADGRTVLAQAPSFGLHESQSRLWENLIGRSRPFWAHYLPVLQEAFEPELRGVTLDDLYRWLNRVEASLVRVEADEVTYNLHILLRFELELQLLRGELRVAELPEAWRARMTADLGVTPNNDVEGVLQDIHWAWAEFGYFPTYTLGNLYSAMLLDSMQQDLPTVWDDVARGALTPIREWLRSKVHREGYRWPAEDLVERITGKRLTEEPFLSYLEKKYRALYGL